MPPPLTVVQTYTTRGSEVVPITVEVDLLRRLPAVCIVGLPASAVRECSERVRSAIEASGFEFPRMRVIVNLTPSDVRKDACAMDLPIALAILIAAGHVEPRAGSWAAIGELSLDGRVRGVRGLYGIIQDATTDLLLFPQPMAGFVAPAVTPEVGNNVPVATLADAIDALTVPRKGLAHRPWDLTPPGTWRGPLDTTPDFADLPAFAPLTAKHDTLVRAVAMGRGILLRGPAGCGASMLAHRIPAILPTLTEAEANAVARCRDLAGMNVDVPKIERPFRAPHHTVTAVGLVGDRLGRPGELDLARHGVLFLDEVTEFRRDTQQAIVSWMRANPGQVQLVAHVDPTLTHIEDWEKRIIPPLRAMLPVEIELPPLPRTSLDGTPLGERSTTTSADLRAQVAALRASL